MIHNSGTTKLPFPSGAGIDEIRGERYQMEEERLHGGIILFSPTQILKDK